MQKISKALEIRKPDRKNNRKAIRQEPSKAADSRENRSGSER